MTVEVEVRYYALIRGITKKKTEKMELRQRESVKNLLHHLIEHYGERLEHYIYDDDGEPRGYLTYMLNGENIFGIKGFETRLRGGDTLSILPPIGGG
ncbi:MAG: ubiquitin-like small modifier protein 1 [Candidatus Bathyarchaeia archaeon]